MGVVLVIIEVVFETRPQKLWPEGRRSRDDGIGVGASTIRAQQGSWLYFSCMSWDDLLAWCVNGDQTEITKTLKDLYMTHKWDSAWDVEYCLDETPCLQCSRHQKNGVSPSVLARSLVSADVLGVQ